MSYVEVPFEVLKEQWNTYYLEDGARIRARVILLKVILEPVDDNVRLRLDANNIIVVSAPPNLCGEAGSPLTMEEMLSFARHGVAVKVLKADERYNVYKILPRGPVFKTKLVASDMAFRLVNRYDEDGQPVYLLGTTLAVMMPHNYHVLG
ncbi:MAG: hypothetical protein QW318_03375 [Candidatus Caldarchaeum sp.]|uniref:Uncharacterized protein n=1 Tax=Caldiarchaeum subterraneum TaxID=311458 RepID=A0A7C4E0A7_CALS0